MQEAAVLSTWKIHGKIVLGILERQLKNRANIGHTLHGFIEGNPALVI